MPYRFTNIIDATTYLTSLGFTVSASMLNWITPLRSSSKRSNLFFESQYVGYIETPTDLLPDEDWCVNIPFEKRSLIPSGVLNAIFGNTEGNEGWQNRQFYVETNKFTRFVFGDELQHSIQSKGIESTIYLRLNTNVLTLHKEQYFGQERVVLGINKFNLQNEIEFQPYVNEKINSLQHIYIKSENRYKKFVVGGDAQTQYVLTHNFGSRAIMESIYLGSNFQKITNYQIYFTTLDTITVTFDSPPDITIIELFNIDVYFNG